MAFPPRIASHAPVIKCSDCGREVDVSSTTNHICSTTPAVNLPPPSLVPVPISTSIEQTTSLLRPQRPVLPKIDSSVSVPTPFAGELTPASSGNGSVGSPVSATSARKLPWKAPRRVAMATPRRPPSPELTNLDCAFPPFPTNGTKAPSKQDEKSSNPRKRAKASKSRPQSPASSRRSSREMPGSSSHSRSASVGSTRRRSKSSPWSNNISRPSTSSSNRHPSVSNGAGSKRPSEDEVPPLPMHSPNLPQSTLERAETAPGSVLIDTYDIEPPRPGVHRFATAGDITRFANATPPTREPSYKAKRPPPIVSNIPVGVDGRPDLGKMRSLTVPPPSSSSSIGRSLTKMFGRNRSRSISSKREVVRGALSVEPDDMSTPPLPTSAYELPHHPPFIVDPLSAPNSVPMVQSPATDELMDSLKTHEARGELKTLEAQVKVEPQPLEPVGTMQFNFDWNSSTHTLPVPPTTTSIAERRQDTSRDSIDSASSYGSAGFDERTASSRSSLPPTDDELAKKMSEGMRLGLVQPILANMPAPLCPRNPESSTDSPTDPFFVDGRLSPIPALHDDTRDETRFRSIDQDVEQIPPVIPHATRQDSLASQGRTLGPHKGICRGCSKAILPQEKSVSSADGRLTGKYHKECFVCWTCKAPFPSAEIYVHADHPYCAHHYHEMENSLCATCGKGIEGLYMETANVAGRGKEKHHPYCLKCTTCRVQLNNDYFELSGKVYCERDAFRLASLPRVHDRSPARPSPLIREYISSGNPDLLKGNNFPERRITRLMTTT